MMQQGRHRRHRPARRPRLHQRRRQDRHELPGPKDVWFVGFTGKYVAAVWLGNDDNRPMAAATPAAMIAAPIWHDFMAVAHTDMNIPTIPGLEPHPAASRRAAAHRAIAHHRPGAGRPVDGRSGSSSQGLAPSAGCGPRRSAPDGKRSAQSCRSCRKAGRRQRWRAGTTRSSWQAG